MSVIVPAIIPKSLEHLTESMQSIAGVSEIHIDVVDGQFVPFVSWPYRPEGDVPNTYDLFKSMTLEVDIMAKEVSSAVEQWVEAGADMIVLHLETLSLAKFKSICNQYKNCSFGISALNTTPDEWLFPYLAEADYVQVMGIEKIGAQGQGFDNRVFARIEKIKRTFPTLPISIDGSVNALTLPKIATAKLDRHIVGSAIMGKENPKQAILDLRQLLR